MGSSKSSSLYDPVRGESVKSAPEEIVRQSLVLQMTQSLGYPKALIAVEKELRQLPHLQQRKDLPRRRIDIVAFAHNIHPQHPLFPLLLIECKAVPLSPKVATQAISYNDSVGAPFVAIANGTRVLTGRYDESAGMYQFKEGLPTFEALVSQV